MKSQTGYIAELVDFWNAKIDGTHGIASIRASNEAEAIDGQMAFKASATQTDFPWENARIVSYDDNTDRIKGKNSPDSDPFNSGKGLDYTKRKGRAQPTTVNALPILLARGDPYLRL